MTNLTEHKGNKTHYYIKFPNNEVIIGDEFALSLYRNCKDGDKIEVLSEVPSFEQWQAKLEENTKLKELLKECRSPINYALCLNLSEEEKIDFKNLLAKIKQVLGEE